MKETISQIILKKNKAGDTMFPNFKFYYKDKVIKTMGYWHKTDTRFMEQKREHEMNPHSHEQLTTQEAEYTMWKRQSLQATELGIWNNYMGKTQTQLLSHTIQNHKLKTVLNTQM